MTNSGINCGCRRVSAEQGGQEEVRWHVRVHPMCLLLYLLPIGMYMYYMHISSILYIRFYVPHELYVWVVVLLLSFSSLP